MVDSTSPSVSAADGEVARRVKRHRSACLRQAKRPATIAGCETVIAGRRADPDVAFAEFGQFVIDLRGNKRVMGQVIDGSEVDGGDAVLLVMVDDPLQPGD